MRFPPPDREHSRRPPLALQDRDRDLLRTAHEYRLISTPQYLRLFSTESRDAIYTRLQKLFHHGYLDRLGENPNTPLIYALGRRGAEVLEVSRRKEVGARYLAHQLMIGDFRIAVTLAARAKGIILTWRTIPQALPVRPDGFFSLHFPDHPEGRNRAHFCLEADRSTMTRERFVDKLRAYHAWQAAGGHTRSLGIRTFRVLSVTKSEERLRSLVAAVAHHPALGSEPSRFWFTALPRIEAAGGVLQTIWGVPDASGCLRSVLP